MKLKSLLHSALYHTVAIAVSALFLVIFVWFFGASLREPAAPPPRELEWIPDPVTWSNYTRVFELVPMANYMLNSAIVVLIALPLTLITSSWAGFAIAQYDRRTRLRWVALSIVMMMVPVTALWLPRFIIFTRMGLINTRWALIIPALMGSSPLFILLFYWSFRRFPQELYESALIDGASALKIWALIAMPLAKPAVATVAVLTFMMYWSDFMNPLLYIKSGDLMTMAVGLRTLQQMDSTNWPLFMAGAVLMTAPLIVLFLLIQRYFWPEGWLHGFAGK